jgi:hypothetical protein
MAGRLSRSLPASCAPRQCVSEATSRDGISQDPHFALSQTPAYVGRAVAALAADPEVMRWSGRALSSWGLAREYGFRDDDGSQPDWGPLVGRGGDGRGRSRALPTSRAIADTAGRAAHPVRAA